MMIGSLHIKNVGIIEDITINLNEGFNVFTGETGAGKTLIIDSLQILAGGRFSKEIIRKDSGSIITNTKGKKIYVSNDIASSLNKFFFICLSSLIIFLSF